METPKGKQAYLKRLCFPGDGKPNARLIRDLQARLGPRQLREVLLGVYDEDERWQGFCIDLLDRHQAALCDLLLARVVREKRHLEEARDVDLVVAEVLYESLYGSGGLRTEVAAQLRERAYSPAPLSGDLTKQLLQSLLLLNVSAVCLARFENEAVESELLDLLSRGPRCTSSLVTLALFEDGEVDRLCALMKRLPIEKLAAIVDAVPVEVREPLERVARIIVEGALRQMPCLTLPFLEAAVRFLPLAQGVAVCLQCLGGAYEKLDPRPLAFEVLLAHAPEAAAMGRQYLAVALVIDRHLDGIAAAAGDSDGETDELAAEDLHRSCWTWITSVVQKNPKAASDLDDEALVVAATVTLPPFVARHMLRFRTALGGIAAELLELLGCWGEKENGSWFVYALRGQTTLYIPAFNALLTLRASAWPCIAEGLRLYPDLVGPLARLAERIGDGDPPPDIVEAIAGAATLVEDDELANVAVLLARARHSAAEALLTRLLKHANPYLQAAGLHAASLAGVSTILPSVIVSLLHPVQHVRAEARYALLRWQPRTDALARLRRAARSRSTVLQLKALELLHALGDATLGALLEELGQNDRLPADLPKHVPNPALPPPEDAVLGPKVLTPPGYQGPLLAHWRRYWLRLSRHPKLFRLFSEFSNVRMLDDEQYLEVRDAVSPAGGCLQWFLCDLVEDYTLQLRGVFELFFGLSIPDETWQGAVFAACRKLDRRYLAAQWQRGRPDLVLGQAEGLQWQLAIRWLIEDELRQRLRQELDKGLLYQALPNPQRQRVICEWLWLNFFPNWYWAYDVRPRLSLEELVSYVVESGWERFKDDGPLDTRIAHQIIDYLALYATALPCPVTFKGECREALWKCFQPLVLKHRRRCAIAAKAEEREERLARFGRLIRDCFGRAVDEYDAFWGGPPEPVLPMGIPLMRLSKLPKNVYGRGVPFAHFFERRLAHLLNEPVPGPGELPLYDDVDSSGDAKRKPKQRISAPGKHVLGQMLLPSEAFTDSQDRDWVTIRGLVALTDVPESTLRRYGDKKIIPFQRVKNMRVVPAEDALPQLIEDILAYGVLTHPTKLIESYDVSSRTLRRWIQSLPPELGSSAKLRRLSEDHPPPAGSSPAPPVRSGKE